MKKSIQTRVWKILLTALLAFLSPDFNTAFADDEVSPLVYRRRLPQSVRFTRTNARFTRVTTGMHGSHPRLDARNFEGAWRDPSGMVWGKNARNRDRELLRLNLADAKAYCRRIRASLPTYDDLIRLRGYFGADPSTPAREVDRDYRPQIIPGLFVSDEAAVQAGDYAAQWFAKRVFWSSSPYDDGCRDCGERFYAFSGREGTLPEIDAYEEIFVRCVAR